MLLLFLRILRDARSVRGAVGHDRQSAAPTDQTPTAAPSATDSGPGLDGAAAAMASMSSYAFTMTLAGGNFDDMYAGVGGVATANTAYPVDGTIVTGTDGGTDCD